MTKKTKKTKKTTTDTRIEREVKFYEAVKKAVQNALTAVYDENYNEMELVEDDAWETAVLRALNSVKDDAFENLKDVHELLREGKGQKKNR